MIIFNTRELDVLYVMDRPIYIKRDFIIFFFVYLFSKSTTNLMYFSFLTINSFEQGCI